MAKFIYFLFAYLLVLTIVSVNSCRRRHGWIHRNSPSGSPSPVSGTHSPTTAIRPRIPPVVQRKSMLFNSIQGHHLKDCSYIARHIGSITECTHLCLMENGQCQSINFVKSKNNYGFKCLLNNSTREYHRKKFVKDTAYSYLEPKKAWVNGNSIWIDDIS